MTEWKLAAGSCGFNTGTAPIEGAYVNGVALFAWSSNGHPVCVVTGLGACGGETADHAKAKGVRVAEAEGPRDADRKLSRKQFEAVMADPERHD